MRARALMCASIINGIGCLMLPVFAMAILNQDWFFEIPVLNIEFLPWRIFMIVCAIPGLVCGIAFYFFPESPKFLLSENKHEESLEILRTIFSSNTGEPKENYKVSNIISEYEDLQFSEYSKKEGWSKINNFLDVLWKQTFPLFNKKFIRNSLIICFIQFGLFSVSSGMALWLPDITNSITAYINEFPGDKALFCDIYNNKANLLINQTEGVHDACVEKFDELTFNFLIIVEAIFTMGFVVFSFLITIIPKRLLTCEYF